MVTSGQIQSMTGFGQAQLQINPRCVLSIEFKSVNSRFLDLTFKVPDDVRAHESLLRELIGKQVKRGKLECRVSLKNTTASANEQLLNADDLQRVLALAQRVQAQAEQSGLALAQFSALDLLRWPGMLGNGNSDEDRQAEGDRDAADISASHIEEAAQSALVEFSASRLREGAQTSAAMLGYVDRIEALTTTIELRLIEINAELLKRFTDKAIERLGSAIHEALDLPEVKSRITQELVLLAMRADVSEELSRLKSHILEIRKILTGAGPVGKKLDFLMQEFNREANTLGSKAPSVEVSKVAVELKLLIEQIREQVQNLE
jgi:uncharacterized protein (TIGR00255 family)